MMKVLPIYGYGWAKGNAFIEVPAPFQIRQTRADLEKDSAEYEIIVGQVTTVDHQFNGLWTLLSLRSVLDRPAYNVYIYKKEPPFAIGGQIDPYAVTHIVSGFAYVDKNPTL